MPETPSQNLPRLLYQLDDRPPVGPALLAALAHLLAIVASIMTAPLLIARGIGLDAALTTYAIASALVVSGLATAVQILRPFGLGSGLLSIQGTSFTFIGPFVFATALLGPELSAEERMGTLLGSAAAGAFITFIAGYFIESLQRIFTRRVAGTVIFLLGLSLVDSAWSNLQRAAGAAGAEASWIWIQALVVIVVITACSRLPSLWVRLGSICIGLLAGCAVAAATTGLKPAPEAAGFTPLAFWPYPLTVSFAIVPLLLPIFLVSMTESVGDLTATAMLSRQPLAGPKYWRRVRGGIMADGANSILAALFGSFPNTTFSQNNGVIQLTGVASRFVGLLVAAGLIVAGLIPALAANFQRLPDGVLYGATGLMFALIAVAGLRILWLEAPRVPALTLALAATLGAFALSGLPQLAAAWDRPLGDYAAMLLGFPVATGAMLAVTFECLLLLLGRTAARAYQHH
ncbi:MAG: solute carrier family 23 protein [Pseudomonadota bacterium]